MTQSHSINRILPILLLWVFFATSCEEPIDLDIANSEPQLVVSSHFQPGHPFQVTITKSRNILSSEADEYVNNAVVRVLTQSGRELDKLQLKNFRNPIYESRRLLPESGKAYRLEVNTPDQEKIVAEDIVPFPVALEEIRIDTIEVFGEAEDRVYKVAISVQFDDPIGAQDYYHLRLYKHIVTEESNLNISGFAGDGEVTKLMPLMPLESDKDNPAVTFHYEDGGILFTDEDFDGQKSALKFYSLLSFNNEERSSKLLGELRTVSESYYLYHTSLSRQIANKDRPFVEPISVFSNIENGLGIFSGYAVFRDSVFVSATF